MVQGEMTGVTVKTQRPTISASRIATFRTGSRDASQKSTLNISNHAAEFFEESKEQCGDFGLRRAEKDTQHQRLAAEDRYHACEREEDREDA